MAGDTIAIGAALLLGTAAFVVWASDPARATNRLIGAILLLWGGAAVFSAMLPGAADERSALTLARVSVWYTLPVPALLVASVPLLVARPAGLAERVWIGAVAAITAGALLTFALDPTRFVVRVLVTDGRWGITSGPYLYWVGASAAAAEAYVIARVGLALRRGDLAPAPRANAGAFAYAIALPLLHTASFFTTFLFAGSDPSSTKRAAISIAAGLLALVPLVWVVREFPRTRALLAGGLGVVLLVGLVDGIVGARRLAGSTYGGYATSLVFVRLAFAFALSMSAIRFGLAGGGTSLRRRAGTVVWIGALVGVAILTLSVALVALGTTQSALTVSLGLAIIVPAAAARPLRGLATRLLLPPSDPRAIAERARTYASALAAARGADGALLAEGEKLLAQMREDLGITLQEHELLLSGVQSRDKERYHKVETLGRGSTAQVELAVDEVAGKRVVIKRFKGLRDPAAVLQEARSLAAVRHARVVPFLEVDRRGDEVYLVLAYAEGGSARQLLDRDGPLAPARAVALTSDLLEGLEALHAAGLVHCDVKPENLLLTADGRGLLGDFGSARFVAPDLADATLTGAQAEGSLSTASPEALRNAPPAPERDVYAAGALLYRLLTGEHYVDLAHATVFEARERITLDAPRLPHPRVPAALEPVLRRALAKKPAERYHSAGQMREALTAAARVRA